MTLPPGTAQRLAAEQALFLVERERNSRRWGTALSCTKAVTSRAGS